MEASGRGHFSSWTVNPILEEKGENRVKNDVESQCNGGGWGWGVRT